MLVNTSTQSAWRQRIALIRYALQASSRTKDYTFFKTIQASSSTKWSEDLAQLLHILPEESQMLVRALHDLNISIAIVHQDSYKAIYDELRTSSADPNAHSRKARLQVDICQQKQATEFGVVKAFNAVVTLIGSQPEEAQEHLASIFIFGLSIVADAIQECQLQTDRFEQHMDDFILLEYAWQSVQSGVTAASSFLRKGLTGRSADSAVDLESVNSSVNLSAEHCFLVEPCSRRASTASTSGSLFKRISGALYANRVMADQHSESVLTPSSSTRTSVSFTSLTELRNTIEDANPTKLHARSKRYSHDPELFSKQLSAIPASPFVGRENVDPFDLVFSVSSPGISDLDATPRDEYDIDPLEADPMASPPIGVPITKFQTSKAVGIPRKASAAFMPCGSRI